MKNKKPGRQSGRQTENKKPGRQTENKKPGRQTENKKLGRQPENTERLQRILARAGLSSRRKCEEIILQGRVSVDGKIVKKIGIKVDPHQKICCDGELLRQEKKCYFLFYKPKGVLCTNSPYEYPKVIDYFPGISSRLFTIGRLDRESEGLILVTNDGDFSYQMEHPSHDIDRIYHVRASGHISPEEVEKIRQGIWTSQGKLSAENIKIIRAERDFSILEMAMKEGKNREIRRILSSLGHKVKKLIRIRFGIFELGKLKPGFYNKIEEHRIADLLLMSQNKKA